MAESKSGVVCCDEGEAIVFASDGFLHIVGLTAKELQSHKLKFSELSPAGSEAADVKAREECLRTGSSAACEKEIVRGDGGRVPILQQSVLTQDPQRRWIHFVLALSELKTNERCRRIVDHLGEGIWEVNAKGLTTFINLAMADLLGYRSEEVVGAQAFNLILDEDQPAAEEVLLRRKTGEGKQVDLRLRRKDGSEVWCSLRVEGLPDEGGQSGGAVALVADITERRAQEETHRRREEELRLIAEELPLLIAYVDSEERYHFCNREYQRWFGHPTWEIPGKGLKEILGEAAYAAARPHFEAALSGRVADHEVLVRAPHRGERRLSASYVPHFSPGGGVRGFVVLMQDVTQSRKEEEGRKLVSEASAILASTLDVEIALQRVARLVTEKLADGCLVDLIGDDGSIERKVIACADPALEPTAWEFTRRFPPSSGAPAGIGRVLRTGQAEMHEEVTEELIGALTADEEHLAALRGLGLRSLVIVPLPARGRTLGTLTLAMGASDRRFGREELELAQDLGERAAHAVDNARLYREAQDANRMKDDFLAIVSHEIRTPLTAILGWAQLLSAGGLTPERVAEAIETIERNAKAQSRLIDDLLDHTRILRGKIEMNIERLQLEQVIQEALGSVVPAARSKGIQITSRFDPQSPAVQGDAARLRQVLGNLLSNAIKFTPEGGKVEVRLGRRGRRAEIIVSDTGMGISPDFLPHVFEPFRRRESLAGRRATGLGLGLAIVKHLVELHGGAVEAQSPGVGRGTTFLVTLPGVTEAASQLLPKPGLPPGRALTPDPFPPSLEGLRVLLVDDEADARRLISTVLELCGAQVLAVSSAGDALGRMESFRPEILLVDIGMPGETGWDLIRKVRSLEPGRGGTIPAAAVSAFTRNEDRLRSMEAGFQVHLPKPVEPTRLVEVVASLRKSTVDS